MNSRARACLDYGMKRCLAPCLHKISAHDYRLMIGQLENFMNGQGGQIVEEIKAAMNQASAREEYEQAALLRDRLRALTRTLENQQAEGDNPDLDAWGIYEDETVLRIAIIRVRTGKLVSTQVEDFSQAALDGAQAIAQGLLTYYHQDNPPPGLILLSHMPDDVSLVSENLSQWRQDKIELRMPQRGDKRQLLELAIKNAASAPISPHGPSPRQVLAVIRDKLAMAELPQRMECVDNSHLAGNLTVASVACFVGGQPLRSHYRRYKLNDIPPGDDYAAMGAAISRRLNSSREWPDLLLVDGGKGQLAIALDALARYRAANPQDERRLQLAAIAKDQQRAEDKIYLPGRKNPLKFRPRDPALALLMHLRDEAHGAALGYHRLLRKKSFTRSILEEISGLGPKNRKKIWRRFSSLKELKAASPLEISQKAGVPPALAQRVAAFLAASQAEE
jgi:excinuclease ABC subunit C